MAIAMVPQPKYATNHPQNKEAALEAVGAGLVLFRYILNGNLVARDLLLDALTWQLQDIVNLAR